MDYPLVLLNTGPETINHSINQNLHGFATCFARAKICHLFHLWEPLQGWLVVATGLLDGCIWLANYSHLHHIVWSVKIEVNCFSDKWQGSMSSLFGFSLISAYIMLWLPCSASICTLSCRFNLSTLTVFTSTLHTITRQPRVHTTHCQWGTKQCMLMASWINSNNHQEKVRNWIYISLAGACHYVVKMPSLQHWHGEWASMVCALVHAACWRRPHRERGDWGT